MATDVSTHKMFDQKTKSATRPFKTVDNIYECGEFALNYFTY